MSRLLDQIVVIDVESTCWEKGPPPDQASEIIEVGICLLDVQMLLEGKPRSVMVRPEQSRVTEFCTKLTTLTQADVDQGMPLLEACRILAVEYQVRDRMWASYGDYDREQFRRECGRKGIQIPFGRTHLNIKSLLAAAAGFPKEVGMDEALQRLKLPLKGTHHRAGDDAQNIAAILRTVLLASRTQMRTLWS